MFWSSFNFLEHSLHDRRWNCRVEKCQPRKCAEGRERERGWGRAHEYLVVVSRLPFLFCTCLLSFSEHKTQSLYLSFVHTCFSTMPEGMLPQFLLSFHEASCFCLVLFKSPPIMKVQSLSWPDCFLSVLRITKFIGWKYAYNSHDPLVWFCLMIRKKVPGQAKWPDQGEMLSGRASTRIPQMLLVLEDMNSSLSSSQHSLCIQVDVPWPVWPQSAFAPGCITEGSTVWPSSTACVHGPLGYTLELLVTLGFTLDFFP